MGTEFALLLATEGVTLDEDCHCQEFLQKMNRWGPDGCDEHFRMIIEFWDFELKRQKKTVSQPITALVSAAIRRAT